MLDSTFIKTYAPPAINKGEIFRYANMKPASQNDGKCSCSAAASVSEIESLIDECIAESKNMLTYKVCYKHFPVKRLNSSLDLSFASTSSKDLAKNLANCDEIILFAATLGIGIDRLIYKYNKISPVKALILQAFGTERVEALCDTFCASLNGRPRFSPGYGDLPLELQMDIFTALDCNKIGLTLNQSLLMSPSKSVTAIVGLNK